MLEKKKPPVVIKHLKDFYDSLDFRYKPVTRIGSNHHAPGQGADGYGEKISTDYTVVAKKGKVNRSFRVYCSICSNIGSLYVLVNGEKLYVNDTDIQADLDRKLEMESSRAFNPSVVSSVLDRMEKESGQK